MNVQQIIEKTRINQTKLLLSLGADTGYEEPGHQCADCGFDVISDEEACETVDSLDELEESLPAETKAALVYIAGYVTRHDAETNEESLLGVTTFYHQEFGGYTDSLDRGGLNIPSDKACQWAIHSYIMFTVVKDRVCRSSFMNIALALSDMCEFEMEVRHARILTNIFIKNHCVAATPRSTKEPALKRLKLSETS